jgi:hypothetical protein
MNGHSEGLRSGRFVGYVDRFAMLYFVLDSLAIR